MSRPRTMTGDTLTDEKTDATLSGDAIIEIGEDDASTRRYSSQCTTSSSLNAPENEKKRPNVLRRITGSFQSAPEPEDVTETRTRILEDTPNGFPRLAAFQSSEANFSLYRSFSYLHSRVLLDLQDEITSLEKELDEKDWDDNEEDSDRLRSREIDIAHAKTQTNKRTRRVILSEIRVKLMEYDEVLIKARHLESFQKPSDRNYRSVRRYHHNTKPLMDAETDSIRSKEDTISLHNGREWASFDGAIESLIGRTDHLLQKIFGSKAPPLQKLFRTKDVQIKTRNSCISFYSSSRIDTLVNILITLVIFILLVIPVICLFHLSSTAPAPTTQQQQQQPDAVTAAAAAAYNRDTLNAVGVLVVFTLVFSAAMSLVTRAARHELFAASAAYCAILVVFVGNFAGGGK